MDQLGWGGDSCLSLSAPEVAPTEQLSPAPPPAGNPPLSPARPCCRFCRIACGIRTFAICFPCATRNFFLVPVLCTLLLRPHNAACCCARSARRPPLPPAALLLRLLRSHTVALPRSTLAASRGAARCAPSRPAARSATHWLALNGPNTGYTQDIKHELSKQVRSPAPRATQQLYFIKYSHFFFQIRNGSKHESCI